MGVLEIAVSIFGAIEILAAIIRFHSIGVLYPIAFTLLGVATVFGARLAPLKNDMTLAKWLLLAPRSYIPPTFIRLIGVALLVFVGAVIFFQ